MMLWALYQAKWEWPFYSCSLYDRDKQVVNTEMTPAVGLKRHPHTHTNAHTRACLHTYTNTKGNINNCRLTYANTHTHWYAEKNPKEKKSYTILPNTQLFHVFMQTHTHTDTHPRVGSVNTHIDHLLIYRSSMYCKQQHGFFCFHKIHTQFIHFLEANQCASLDVE